MLTKCQYRSCCSATIFIVTCCSACNTFTISSDSSIHTVSLQTLTRRAISGQLDARPRLQFYRLIFHNTGSELDTVIQIFYCFNVTLFTGAAYVDNSTLAGAQSFVKRWCWFGTKLNSWLTWLSNDATVVSWVDGDIRHDFGTPPVTRQSHDTYEWAAECSWAKVTDYYKILYVYWWGSWHDLEKIQRCYACLTHIGIITINSKIF